MGKIEGKMEFCSFKKIGKGIEVTVFVGNETYVDGRDNQRQTKPIYDSFVIPRENILEMARAMEIDSCGK